MLKRSYQVIAAIYLSTMAMISYAQSNPVFEISTDSANVHYDRLPQNIEDICKHELQDYRAPFPVFAHIKSGDYEYYAEWGNIKRRDLEEYDRAGILEIHGGTCKGWSLEDTLGTQRPPNGYHGAESVEKLPGDDSPCEGEPPNRVCVFRSAKEEFLLREFVRDAIKRAIKAYGGDRPFRTRACKPDVEAVLVQEGYLIVLQELKTYCSGTPEIPSNND